ncbi:MAG: glycine betaine/L-proline ABC transporter ATP-binding protein [Caldilineaceae bacterium]|nr:glycine betaine/L-proline ABC transporter ATP-binding protein [Caldilineaceae bacterium]
MICRGLWKIFGPEPERVAAALAEDASKADALAQSGHVVAVRDVSFDVRIGETFVVMGLSGSGKSTLLRCLPRLIVPTRGDIRIDGAEITTMRDKALRDLRRHKLSMVFQHFGLFPHRTVLDNVAYGLEVQGVKKAERYARAHIVLEQVNLQGWDQHYPSELSGGMQQRVGLARALAVDPEILLFDEPFSALDPLIRREMQDELLHLQQQMHKTIVFITHDFAEAIKLADATKTGGGRIAIMKDGLFVQVGSAEEILLHPQTDYVAEFTKDVPRTSVLTARAIMEERQPAVATGHPIDAALKLNELITLFADTDATLPVIDDDGTIIGSLNRRAVMVAISGNGATL